MQRFQICLRVAFSIFVCKTPHFILPFYNVFCGNVAKSALCKIRENFFLNNTFLAKPSVFLEPRSDFLCIKKFRSHSCASCFVAKPRFSFCCRSPFQSVYRNCTYHVLFLVFLNAAIFIFLLFLLTSTVEFFMEEFFVNSSCNRYAAGFFKFLVQLAD